MKIDVKLFATLRKLLPPRAEGSTATIEISPGLTVGGLIEHLKIPKEMAHLILVNGVNIEGNHARPLQDGDTVSVFPPVAGGCWVGIRGDRSAAHITCRRSQSSSLFR